MTVHHIPLQGATVTVTPLVTADIRTLTSNDQGDFRTQYELNSVKVSEFSAILTVKKKGFQTAHAFIDYGNPVRTREVTITLREPEEDPALLSPADLISGLAPRLRQFGPGDGLATNSEKDYTEGVESFLDQHNCERAVPLLAKVLENNPSCVGCRTMLALAELGWGDWDDAYQTLAEGVHAMPANPRAGRTEQLVAYGTWVSWQHEPENAATFLQEALKSAPQDAMALQELGRALVAMRDFEAAKDALNKALAAGAGPEAQLLDVEALVGEGDHDEAAREMGRYLNGRDVKKMPARVREVWATVQNQGKVEALPAKTRTREGPANRVTAREAQGRPVVAPEGRAPASLALLDLQHGYIKDFAGALDATTVEKLNEVSTEVDQKARAQIAVVTIKDLEGDTVEDFANHLFQKWGMGHKGTDRGVMVLLAMRQRKYCTKVGGGLEPILPDGKVLDFERGMVPLLRQGNYSSALMQFVSQITEVIEQDSHVSIESLAGSSGGPAKLPPPLPADLLQGIEPAKDQEQLGSILAGVGANIVELIKNFPNTSSLEVIHQEKVGHKGGGVSQNQRFRYLCLAPSEISEPSFIEYRTDFAGNEARPEGLSEGFMLTTGFTSAALIFHPQYRGESTFQYLGRQKISGRNAFVMAFAQIPGKARFTGNFLLGSNSGTMFSQGVAWIDTATYQIIRLHTELLAPLPELRLEKEDVNIDFNEVQFKSLKGALWLPEKVIVAIDWNGKQLRNQHEYSDFKIFQVDTSQEIGKPKNSKASSKETPVPTVSR